MPSADNMPRQLSSFVGRKREIAEIERLVAATSLLTLTGAGGSGKTRLALKVASGLRDKFQHDVMFVDLAPITNVNLVASTIARAIGMEEVPGIPVLESLKYFLHDKHALLMLDNFEQVLEAAPIVAGLLAAAPDLKVMVTSREPLRLRGEQRYRVPTLEVPDLNHKTSIRELSHCEAVALFIQRTQAVRPQFSLTQENAAMVAEICQRLDGLPLAIELAAARVGDLQLRTVAERLGSKLKLLTGGPRDAPARQQTLRNTIEWSYSLLSDGEKQLFRRMAVFQGGHRLQALEAVCNYDGQLQVDVSDGVEALVSKSLLQERDWIEYGDEGELSFWMLETIHEYAAEKLKESGEWATLRQEHALYFMRLAEEAHLQIVGPKQVQWLNRLEEEHDNFRAGLQWSQEEAQKENNQALETGLRLATGIGRFWDLRGYFTEGRGWLAVLLSSADAINTVMADIGVTIPPPKGLIGALNTAAWLARRQGDYDSASILLEKAVPLAMAAGDKTGIALSFVYLGLIEHMRAEWLAARSLYEHGLALFREVGDRWGTAFTLNYLGDVSLQQRDHQTAHTLLEQSLSIMRDIGDKRGMAQVLGNLGKVPLFDGDYPTARILYEQNLALRVEIGDRWGTSVALTNLGIVYLMQKDYNAARSVYEQSLAQSRELGDMHHIATSLAGLGEAYIESAQKEQAVRGATLIGASDVLYQAINAVMEWDDRMPYDQAVASARAQIGEEEFEQARQQGRNMNMEAAIRYAVADQPQAAREASALPSAPYPFDLTKREVEVLGLVAQGLTNAQVAQQLFLSPATVNAHLTSVYGKLGVSGRNAATRFAVEHNLG